MMRSNSPRFLLSVALGASLSLLGCGDSDDPGKETGTTGDKSTNSQSPSGTQAPNTSSGPNASGTDNSGNGSQGGTTSSSGSTSNTSNTSTTSTTSTTNTTSTTSTTSTPTDTSSTTTEPAKLTLTKDVQPIFTASCSCHTKSASPAAGLNLSVGASYDSLIGKNGKNGKPFVTPKDVANSYLHGTLTHALSVKMPAVKLSDDKIKVVADWINDGALK